MTIKKFLASFNNYEEACTMLCGKGRVRTQDLGYQAERYEHCTARPVTMTIKYNDSELEITYNDNEI
jgi:hypothetical protein